MPRAAPAPTRPGSAAQQQAQRAWLQGQTLARQGRWTDAARQFETATRLQPRDALYFLNLADAQLKSGDLEKALATAQRACAAEPDSPLALALQANALVRLNRTDELLALLDAQPAERLSADLQALQGQVQLQCNRPQQAVNSLLAALAQRPADADLHQRLGQAFNLLHMKREAAECFRTALLLGLGERQAAAQDLLAFYEREVCDWRGGDTQVQALRQSIASLPADAAVPTNPFAHVTLLDDPYEQLRAAAICSRHIASTVTPLPPRAAQAAPRLRIGYVSADFRRHATAYLTAELFERHDRARFEVLLYSLGPADGSPMRRRLEDAADQFVDAQAWSPQTLAERIRADRVDILVDLKGYTQDARPAVFAYRPAPVQVAYLGFPGSSGADFMDYVVGDSHVTPLEAADQFSEKIAQLPGCYQCNDGTRALPVAPPRASVGLPDDALVLCGFNQPYKISPQVFDVWCRLLQQLPQAVLWLLEWTPQAPEALRREAAARGVDPARLIFAPTVGQAEHLDRIACADLFLDTWPCNAHTTASDVLWAGVPLVTLSGRTFASRVAGSLLHAVQAPELICTDVAAYEALALQLAQDATQRQAWRTHLQAMRARSPLFSSARLAPQLEALYQRMWQRAVDGLPPAALAAEVLQAQVTAEVAAAVAAEAPADVTTTPAADTPAPQTAGVEQRLQQLEALGAQLTTGIDQLVDAVLSLRQTQAAASPPAVAAPVAAPPADALAAAQARIQALENRLSVEVANRDLAQVSRMHRKQRRAVFVGTTYFGCNVKYAWAAAREQARSLGLDVWFLPFDQAQQALVTQLGGQVLPADHTQWSAEHVHMALSAALVVTSDHLLNPNPFAAALLAGARQVQLWHGVSIKEIGLRNLAPGRDLGPQYARVLATCGPYARMVGTAVAGEAEWRRWFAFDRYAPVGYPRNDVLYREPGEADLAGCDREAYAAAQAALARGRRVLLYAPTFRDGRPEWVLAAGLPQLAAAARQRGDLLIVNLHPVESPLVPKLAKVMPGVVFVQPRTDLYPLLSRVSALITDYSSVMFDYLHLDRPVLFFRPDHAAYTATSRQLFDDKLSALPGPLFEAADGLARALHSEGLAQQPQHAAVRQALRAQWFDHHDGDSAARLMQVLQEELQLAAAEPLA